MVCDHRSRVPRREFIKSSLEDSFIVIIRSRVRRAPREEEEECDMRYEKKIRINRLLLLLLHRELLRVQITESTRRIDL